MYATFLVLHNLTRWLVLVFGFWALYRLADGWIRRRSWGRADRLTMRWFALIISLQFVFGAVLYLLPGALVQGALSNAGMATIMKSRILRFFTLEHPLQMFIAIGVSHMANMITRRMSVDRRRFVTGTLLLSLAMLLILVAIPWPFLSHGRPLLRLP
ncbi:MAG TPA: hypothetical protein VGD69_25180 [Herpetosiphonaceae bacterium]